MARKTIIVGIYLIENLINGKKYVGQSKNVLARWSGHKCDSKNRDLPLYRAMRKYGLENFKFSILEECSISELASREDYWMNYYDSFLPNGYNYNKAEAHYTNLSIPNKYKKIIFDIKYTDKLLKDIAVEYQLKPAAITAINQGKTWRLDNETYPLRGRGDIDIDYIVQLLKDNFSLKEIATYFEVTIPTIKGILYSNNIKVTDIRSPLSSSKRIKLINITTNEVKKFRKRTEAAEWMYNNIDSTVCIGTLMNCITRHLKNNKPYKGYLIQYDDILEEVDN